MATVIWGQGLSEDGRETFDSVEQSRAMPEHDTDLSPEELDRLFETGKFVDENNGSWIAIERSGGLVKSASEAEPNPCGDG